MTNEVVENKQATEKENVVTTLPQQSPDVNLKQNVENTQDKTNENEDNVDPNWKAFREARKKDRAEREAAERRAAEKEAEAAALRAAMEAAFSKSAPTPQAYQQYYGMNDQQEETEDEKIEKKVNAILQAKEEKYRREAEEREQREFPNRLMREFPDFAQVVSQENLDYIDFHYPEISRPLQRLPNGYERWYDTYHAVKRLLPNHYLAKKDAAKADANQQKPKSISTTNLTQSGENVRQSWQEIEKRRADRYAEMQRIMKGV